jgi:hypothetical protein
VQGAKFAACIHRHAVPNFPDPNAQGTVQFGSAQGIDPRSPTFSSALSACRKLLPHGLGPPTAGQLAQVQQQLLAFSTCMRAHGIEDFPDPSGGGLPQIQPAGDLDPNNPHFLTAYTTCKPHLPPACPARRSVASPRRRQGTLVAAEPLPIFPHSAHAPFHSSQPGPGEERRYF